MKKPVIKTKIAISMQGLRIEGYISVPEGLRPSDFLNDEEQFVSVTEVKIYDWKGDFLEDKEYMAVNKDRISWIAQV